MNASYKTRNSTEYWRRWFHLGSECRAGTQWSTLEQMDLTCQMSSEINSLLVRLEQFGKKKKKKKIVQSSKCPDPEWILKCDSVAFTEFKSIPKTRQRRSQRCFIFLAKCARNKLVMFKIKSQEYCSLSMRVCGPPCCYPAGCSVTHEMLDSWKLAEPFYVSWLGVVYACICVGRKQGL